MLYLLIAASVSTTPIDPQLEHKAEIVFAAAAGCPMKLNRKTAPVAINDYERGFLSFYWDEGSKYRLNARQCKEWLKDNPYASKP